MKDAALRAFDRAIARGVDVGFIIRGDGGKELERQILDVLEGFAVRWKERYERPCY